MDNNKIGKFIFELRKEHNLTQKEFGEKLFVTNKAVSKWERGQSIPDISVLEQMSKLFDVEISEILCGKKSNKNTIEIERILETERNKIKEKQKKKLIKSIPFIILLFVIVTFFVYRNISFGYEIINLEYEHTYYESDINLGVPKMSFYKKHIDQSYSFKNLRNSNILKTELNDYLKTLKYSTCNDTIYYYNEEDNYSIIEYDVKNYFLFSSISYEVVQSDYCYLQKIDEASEALGYLKTIRIIPKDIDLNNPPKEYLEVKMVDGGDSMEKYEFVIEFEVSYFKGDNRILLEHSYGDYEIKNNKLYYYRTEIVKKSSLIDIPEVSVFDIKNQKLYLIDNYLEKYVKEIIL